MNIPSASTDSNPTELPQDVAFSPGRVERIPKKNTFATGLPAPIEEGFALPAGVVLPDTISPEILTGKPYKLLMELPVTAITEALSEFDAAVKERGNEIRSLPAYLVGVIKRYRTVQQANTGGGQGHQLSERVLARLDRLVSSGHCSQAEIDDKIKKKLAMMTEGEALSAIEELNNIPRSEIRSFPSYFMGIMNRYANNKKNNSYPNNNHQQKGRDNRKDRRDRHSGGSSDSKYAHYGRGADDDRYGRDDSRSRRRSRSRSRSRSRDRHDRRRRRSYSYSTSRSRSRSRDRDDRHSHRRRRRSRSNDRSHSRRGRKSRFSNVTQVQNHGVIPPPPPPRAGMIYPPPPPGQFSRPPPNMQAQQSVNDQQLEELFRVALPHQYQAKTAPPPPTQSQPNQQINLPANLSRQQIEALQAILQQGPSAQPPPPAQTGAPAGWPGHVQQVGNPVNQTQPWQQPPPTQATVATWPVQTQAQVPPPAAPLDILGLAEKAAQALSSVPGHGQNHHLAAPPPAVRNNMHSNMTEKDLPQMVQFAIQNLRISGHITEPALDQGVCAMLAKISEQSALLSLETFASCDVSKMRNKTAYLLGILKKELVKLGLS